MFLGSQRTPETKPGQDWNHRSWPGWDTSVLSEFGGFRSAGLLTRSSFDRAVVSGFSNDSGGCERAAARRAALRPNQALPNVAQAFGHDAPAWAKYQGQFHARIFKGLGFTLRLRVKQSRRREHEMNLPPCRRVIYGGEDILRMRHGGNAEVE